MLKTTVLHLNFPVTKEHLRRKLGEQGPKQLAGIHTSYFCSFCFFFKKGLCVCCSRKVNDEEGWREKEIKERQIGFAQLTLASAHLLVVISTK